MRFRKQTFSKIARPTLTPHDLAEPDYELVKAVGIDDLPSHLKEELNKSKAWKAFVAFNYLMIVVLLSFFITWAFLEDSRLLRYFVGGLVATIFLIPIHELIHGFAMTLVGAKRISYGMNLRHLLFWAEADRSVLHSSQFKFVLIAPFAVISCGCLAVIFFAQGSWTLAFVGMFFLHSHFCLGDFATYAFLNRLGESDVYIYEEKENRTSYFYRRIETL